ncbi:MAG: hypothetical protein ACYST6_19705 [Planctomycetota bacterium]
MSITRPTVSLRHEAPHDVDRHRSRIPVRAEPDAPTSEISGLQAWSISPAFVGFPNTVRGLVNCYIALVWLRPVLLDHD